MDDKSLMRFSLLGAIIGIIALYFLCLYISYPHVKIGEIEKSMVGKAVNITGNITDVYFHKDGHVFIMLEDETGRIKVILWESIVKSSRINVSEIKCGRRLQIVGTVEMYKGETEIIPFDYGVKLV